MQEMYPAGPAVRNPRRAGAPHGAKAQHRPPGGEPSRELFKKTTLCRFYAQKNGCERGFACPFAHGKDEMRSKPDLTKTSLCKLWAKGRCPSESWQCPWAHGRHELQGIRTESGELDHEDLAFTECSSEAVSKNDCFQLGGLTEKTDSGRSTGDVSVVFLEAPSVGTRCPSDDEGARAPAGRKECPRCSIDGHSSTARFCVQCGYALVECGQSQCQPQDESPVSPVANAIPVVFGDPGAAMQGPWPVGMCAPGTTVILVPATPQGWMVVPPAAPFALGDLPTVGQAATPA